MRVIAGVAKGRRLKSPPGDATRPTIDRVKEALFSSLQGRIRGASVLDGFAGSGALGIEALSRGAGHATFVERSRRAVSVIEDNLAACGLAGAATVVRGDLAEVMDAEPAGAPYDLILLDPPYDLDRDVLARVLRSVAPRVSADGIVVLEASRHAAEPTWPETLGTSRERRYGDTVLYVAEPREQGS